MKDQRISFYDTVGSWRLIDLDLSESCMYLMQSVAGLCVLMSVCNCSCPFALFLLPVVCLLCWGCHSHLCSCGRKHLPLVYLSTDPHSLPKCTRDCVKSLNFAKNGHNFINIFINCLVLYIAKTTFVTTLAC